MNITDLDNDVLMTMRSFLSIQDTLNFVKTCKRLCFNIEQIKIKSKYVF